MKYNYFHHKEKIDDIKIKDSYSEKEFIDTYIKVHNHFSDNVLTLAITFFGFISGLICYEVIVFYTEIYTNSINCLQFSTNEIEMSHFIYNIASIVAIIIVILIIVITIRSIRNIINSRRLIITLNNIKDERYKS